MEVVLSVLLVAAVAAAIFMGLQVSAARTAATKATHEMDGVRSRLSALESESKKAAEALEAKRKEAEELKERLKDVKKRRHEEKESARLKQDIQLVRDEIEREMEKKLQVAREEAEISKAQVKKLSAEIESIKTRRPVLAVVPKAPAEPTAKAPEAPEATREATPEQKARAEATERQLAVARKKIEELQDDAKKLRVRAETDRRVFLVQKGELEVAKDKFRAMESRFNAMTLERDELKKAVWLLEKELKSLTPTPEKAGAKPPEEPAAVATPAGPPNAGLASASGTVDAKPTEPAAKA